MSQYLKNMSELLFKNGTDPNKPVKIKTGLNLNHTKMLFSSSLYF